MNRLSSGAILLLCLISGFLPLITDGFLAAIRPVMSDFQVPLSAAQAAISVVLLGCACAQLFVGALADRYGRRPVLSVAISLFIAASVGMAFAPSLPTLLLFRFLQGASAAAGPILARAIVRDVYNRGDGARVLSIVAMGLTLIPLLVPSLNAFIVAQFSWRATAVVYVVVLSIALVMTRQVLHETLRPEDATPIQFSNLGCIGASASWPISPAVGRVCDCCDARRRIASWHLAATWSWPPQLRWPALTTLPSTHSAHSYWASRSTTSVGPCCSPMLSLARWRRFTVRRGASLRCWAFYN